MYSQGFTDTKIRQCIEQTKRFNHPNTNLALCPREEKQASKYFYLRQLSSDSFQLLMKKILVLLLFPVCVVHAQETTLTLENIWLNGTFRQNSVYGLRSMEDGVHYTSFANDRGGRAIHKHRYEDGEKIETIITTTDLKTAAGSGDVAIETYAFSDDEQKLLIGYDVEHIYRHSTRENYYIYDLKDKTATRLSSGPKQMYATFSPQGDKVAYVSENNLYIFDPAKNETAQVTKDGERNKVIYGGADWVYEEEFAFDKAFFWSPDGSMIAYYRFDEGEVKEFHMPVYNGLYPEDYRFKYPKAGEKNSAVTIEVYNLETKTTEKLDLGEYEYIPRMEWTEDAEWLAIMKMPRLQNVLELVLVNTKTWETKTVLKETSDAYIEIGNDLTFINDNAGFIWKSEKDGFNHLYYYDLFGGNEQQVTKGEWEVRDFLGFSEDQQRLYFSASKNSPMNTAVYSIKLDGSDMQALTPEEGHSNASFSNGFKYFINYHSDANTPLRVTLHKGDGTKIRDLETNSELGEQLKALDLQPVEFFTFTTPDGVELNGWMIKPADFDKKKKYPVLMHVYGGPGSQTVLNRFDGNFWWHQYMAGKGYIIVSVDNRGTGARGRDFRTVTYKQLGKYETEDQISAAKHLGTLPYVDSERIGIWGWSYGGYMSSLALFKGNEYFKAAVAVAPVSNWRYYDSIYTERYMGLPQDNASGYDENSPINHTDKLQGNYLLVHGTGDDNVHAQNSIEMVDALIASNKQFDFYIYPDRNHGIYGGNTRLHLFTKITDFLIEKL